MEEKIEKRNKNHPPQKTSKPPFSNSEIEETLKSWMEKRKEKMRKKKNANTVAKNLEWIETFLQERQGNHKQLLKKSAATMPPRKSPLVKKHSGKSPPPQLTASPCVSLCRAPTARRAVPPQMPPCQQARQPARARDREQAHVPAGFWSDRE